MSFNVQDKQSVITAQDAGFNKAQEIATALLRLAQRGELNFQKLIQNRAPGEDLNDTDPNITNERHDLYKRTAEEYEKAGADPKTAKDAALDSAILGIGAEESSNIKKAHEQITNQYLDSLKEDIEPSTAENDEKRTNENAHQHSSFRQRLASLGMSPADAKALSKARDSEISSAQAVARGEDALSVTAPGFESRLLKTALKSEVKDLLLDEFKADLDNTYGLGQEREVVTRTVQQTTQAATKPLAQDQGATAKLSSEKTGQLEQKQAKPKLKTANPSIQNSYQEQIEKAGGEPKTAAAAAKELAKDDGKGALNSPSIKQAHNQVIAHQHLKAMYERIYNDMKVPSSIVELASEDAARGLGASTSSNIQKAHEMSQSTTQVKVEKEKLSDTAISDESVGKAAADSNTNEPAKWEIYSQEFTKARSAKYPGDNTKPSDYSTMVGTAVQAFKSGQESRESIQTMIENSPTNSPPRGNKATYAKGIVTKAEGIAKKEMDGTANLRARPKSQAKTAEAAIA